MPSIFSLLSDKDFQALSVDDKRGVMAHFDPDFAKLGAPDQEAVMRHYNLIRPEAAAEDQHPIAKAASDIYTPILEGVGGAGGAALAAPADALTANPLPSVAAGALGVAGGKAAADLIDRATGLKAPIASAADAARETAGDVGTGAVAEMGGRAIGAAGAGALNLATGPFKDKMVGAAKQVYDKAKDLGIDMTPAEVLGSKSLSLFENLLDSLPITGDFMNKFRLKQLQQLVNNRNNLVDQHGSSKTIEELGEQIQGKVDDLFRTETKLGTDSSLALKDRLLQKLGSNQTYEEVGLAGQEALKRATQARYAESGRLYDNVAELINPDVTTVPQSYRQKALDLFEKERKLSPSLQDSELLGVLGDVSGHGDLSGLLNQAAQQLGKSPEELVQNKPFMAQLQDQIMKPMSFSQMSADRSRLGQLIAENDPSHGFSAGAKGAKLVGDKAAGVYKQLFGALDDDMGKIVADAGPDAKNALDLARSFYGESKQLYNQPQILRIARADPEKVVDMVFKPEAVTTVKTLRKAIGGEAFDGLRGKFTDKLLAVPEGEQLSSDMIQGRLNKYGQNLIEEVYKDKAPDILSLPQQLRDLEPTLSKNPFFKTILKKAPEAVVPYLISPNNTTKAVQIASTLGADGKKQVAQGFITMLLKDAAENSHGNFSPNLLDSAINKYGDDTLRAWLPQDTLKGLKDFAMVGERLQKAAALGNNPSGTARMMLTGGLGAYTLLHPQKAAKLIVPAAVMAQLYLTPTGRQLLTEGFQTALTSPESEKIFARLSAAAIATMHGNEDQK